MKIPIRRDPIFKLLSLVMVLVLTASLFIVQIQITNVVQRFTDVVTLGMVGQAYAVAPDYEVDGVNDHVQVQAALDALPAAGGKLKLLGGTYDFAATVTRAIGEVTIEGMGMSTLINWNGADDLFDDGGQNNWLIQNIAVDAGSISLTGTDSQAQNIWIGGTFYTVWSGTTGTGTVVLPADSIDHTELSVSSTNAGTTVSIDDFLLGAAAGNQVPQWNGANWVPATIAGGGNGTDIYYGIISAPNGTNPFATGANETLTFISNDIVITGISGNDTIVLALGQASVKDNELAATSDNSGDTVSITDFLSSGPGLNQIPKWDGNNWNPAADATGAGGGNNTYFGIFSVPNGSNPFVTSANETISFVSDDIQMTGNSGNDTITWVVLDNSHAHTGATISNIDVSDTNLTVGFPLTLTGNLLEVGNATTAALGVAMFDPSFFTVANGNVTFIGSAVVGNLTDIGDVVITGPVDGEGLYFDGPGWINEASGSRSATFVVAASDTSQSGKDRADYVGNGTADNVQIQAAIDAANVTGGGKIILLEGTFYVDATIEFHEIANSIIVQGSGSQSTIIRRAVGFTGTLVEIGDGTNWTYRVGLRDLMLHGQAIGSGGIGLLIQKATHIELANVAVDFFQDGVKITEATQYLEADQLRIGNFSRYGLSFDQLSGNPGHYLFDRLEVSIPSTYDNTTAIYFYQRTDAPISRLQFNTLTLFCPPGLGNTTGIHFDGTTASATVENMVIVTGNIESFTTGIEYGDNATKNVVVIGTAFYGNSITVTGIKGTGFKGEILLLGNYFYDMTTGIDATQLGESGAIAIRTVFSSVTNPILGQVVNEAMTRFVFEGATVDGFETFLDPTDPTADRTVTIPDASGEMSLLGQEIDISGETNLEVGSPLTLTDDLLEVGNATTTELGVATFDPSFFTVTDGNVTFTGAGGNGTDIYFGIVAVPAGTNPYAASANETLTFISDDIVITGTAGNNTVTLALGTASVKDNELAATSDNSGNTVSITDFLTAGPGAGQIPKWNGTNWAPANDATAGAGNGTDFYWGLLDTPLGTDPYVAGANETLQFLNADGYFDITGDAEADTVTFALNATALAWDTEIGLEGVWMTGILTTGEAVESVGDCSAPDCFVQDATATVTGNSLWWDGDTAADNFEMELTASNITADETQVLIPFSGNIVIDDYEIVNDIDGNGLTVIGNTLNVDLALGDLNNVDTTGVANNKIIKYNTVAGEWIIADDAGGDGTNIYWGEVDTPLGTNPVVIGANETLSFRSDGLTITGLQGNDTVTFEYASNSIKDTHIDWGNGTNKVNANDISYEFLSGATYDTLQEWLTVSGSSGVITGGDITENPDGTIDIAAGTGLIRTIESETSPIVFFDFAGNISVPLVDQNTNYIYVDYNNGSPLVRVTTSQAIIFNKTNSVFAGVFRDGTRLHTQFIGSQLADYVQRNNIRNFEIDGVIRTSGMTTTDNGNLTFAITAGVMYQGIARVVSDALNTGTGDTFDYWWTPDSGTNWTEVANQTEMNNTDWNDVTSGLTALTVNRYAVMWLYLNYDGDDLQALYGRGDYTLAQADDAQPPSIQPPIISQFCLLVAKVVIQKNDTTMIIFTPWGTEFTGSFAQNHNDLGAIQGGTAGEYFHLTSSEHVELNGWLDNVTLGVNGALTLPSGQNFSIGIVQWNSGDNIDGTKVANADLGDIGVAAGVWSVEDDSHEHTGATVSGISVANTTLEVGSPLTLTGDLLEIGNATTAALGAAMFDPDDFAVTLGNVTVKADGIDDAELYITTDNSSDSVSITDFLTGAPDPNQIPKWDGSNWNPANDTGAGAGTDFYWGEVDVPLGTNPVVAGANETLTFISNDLTITGTAGNDTIALAYAVDSLQLIVNTVGQFVQTALEGFGIDIIGGTGEGSSPLFIFDPTEVGTATWGNGSAVTYTYNASGGIDPVWTYGANESDLSTGQLKEDGNRVLTTASTLSIDISDDTNLAVQSPLTLTDDLMQVANATAITLGVATFDPSFFSVTDGNVTFIGSAVVGNLTDIGDVTIIGPADGDGVYYTGSGWANEASGSRSATFVIAASDSSQAGKDRADYLCSGADDQVQINAAISALPSQGGGIELLEGNFTTTAAITLLDNVRLEGQGSDSTTIITATNAISVISATGNAGDQISNVYVARMSIRGWGITSAGLSLTYTKLSRFDDVHVYGFDNYGIYMLNSWDNTWVDIYVEWCGSTTDSEAAILLTNDAASATNNQYFYGLHVEPWRYIALQIDGAQGGGASLFNKFFGTKIHGNEGAVPGNTDAIVVSGSSNIFVGTHVERIAAHTAITVSQDAINNQFYQTVIMHNVGLGMDIDGFRTIVDGVQMVGGGTKEVDDGIQFTSNAIDSSLSNVAMGEMDGWGLTVAATRLRVTNFYYLGDEQGILLNTDNCDISGVIMWADVATGGVEPMEVTGDDNRIVGGYYDKGGGGTIDFAGGADDNTVTGTKVGAAITDAGANNVFRRIINQSSDWGEMTESSTGVVTLDITTEGSSVGVVSLHDFLTGAPALNQIPKWDGGNWTWAADGGGGAGDMTKAVYDADTDNDIDLAAGGLGSPNGDPGFDAAMTWNDGNSTTEWAETYTLSDPNDDRFLAWFDSEGNVTMADPKPEELEFTGNMTLQLVPTGEFDFSGSKEFQIREGTDPDVAESGDLAEDNDDYALRSWYGNESAQAVMAMIPRLIPFTVVSPASLGNTSRPDQSVKIFHNATPFTLNLTYIFAESDDDNYSFNLYETASRTDFSMANDSLIDLVTCATDGTDVYTDIQTTFTDGSIAPGACILFAHNSGTTTWVSGTIVGYLDADVP